jgi:broad specificity phosphatase PhoE
VLITHEMIARMLVRNLIGLPVEDAPQISFAQGAIDQLSPPNYIVAGG